MHNFIRESYGIATDLYKASARSKEPTNLLRERHLELAKAAHATGSG